MKTLFTFLTCISFTLPALSGFCHDHGESAFAASTEPTNHFMLTEQQISHLGIESEQVRLFPIQNTVDMLAFTELLPENKETVSARFQGTLLQLKVKVGEEVKKGQVLARVEPTTIGSAAVEILSSIDGTVLTINSTPGETISPNDPVMTLGNTQHLLVKGIMYETPDIRTIQVGQSTEFHANIDPHTTVSGHVQRIHPILDPESRTFSIYALIDNTSHSLQAGLQGQLEVFTGSSEPALTISRKALLGEFGSYFVYVIDEHEVSKKEVTIGRSHQQHIEVISGLSEKDRVVTQGNYQLQYISVGGVHEHHHSDEHEHEHEHAENKSEHKDNHKHNGSPCNHKEHSHV